MFKKIHKWMGKLILRHIKEPISTRLPPQPNTDMWLYKKIKILLGLHYYM